MRTNPSRRDLVAASLVGGTFAAGALVGSLIPARAARGPAPLALHRGCNLWPWFSLTREHPAPRTDYGWPAFQEQRQIPTRTDLARLHEAGFDFARLPVDPGPFLAFAGAARNVLLQDLDAAIVAILEAGLRVVVNLHANAATHHYTPDNLFGSLGAPLFPAYRGLIGELAHRLVRFGPDRVAFEPVNEPPQGCGEAGWNAVQTALLAEARLAAPGLTLIATGACGSLVAGLEALDPGSLSAFRPLIYTFHFYEPYLFSHQGAPWMREPVYRALNAVPWPASAGRLDTTLAAVRVRMQADLETSAAEKAAAYRITEGKMAEYFAADPARGYLDGYLARVSAWAKRHGIAPGDILMGEFGALRSGGAIVAAAAADRVRYVRDVRLAAEAQGFSWAFWNLFDAMGLVDDATRRPDNDLLQALGLKPVA